VADGELTLKQRNRLLEEMTDEVARLVLQDCYWQGRAIGLDEFRNRDLLGEQARFIRALEQRGQVNRALEYLPDEEELTERAAAGEGLTRPEIAILVSYAKHTLYEAVLASDLPEEACLVPELERYFPTPLRRRFSERMAGHRLRREILAATLANRLVNRMGSTFVFGLQEDLDVEASTAVRAYLVAWEAYGLRRLWSAVAELDTQVPDETLQRILGGGVRLVVRASRWLLKRDSGRIDIAADIERYRDGIAALAAEIPDLVDGGRRETLLADAGSLVEAGVPDDLARWIAGFDTLARGLDVVTVTRACEVTVAETARLYFALGAALEFDWLAAQIGALPSTDRWLAAARTGLRDELLEHHRTLSVAVLTGGIPDTSALDRLEAWRHRYDAAIRQWLGLVTELKTQETPDVARLSVALRAVGRLATAASPAPP
jgi:glutamate dehydrogenase